jgi:hypothetical protein
VNQGAVRSASSPHGRGEAGPATTSTSHPTARRLALANYAQACACACATRLTPHPLAPPADRRRRLRRTFPPAFRDGERELYYTSEIYPAGLGAHEREGTERGGGGVYVPSLHEGGPAALRPLLLRRRLRVGRRRVALLRVPLLRWVSLLRVALLRWVALLRRRVARGRVSRRRVRVLPGVTCEIQRRERNTHTSGGYGTRRERRS